MILIRNWPDWETTNQVGRMILAKRVELTVRRWQNRITHRYPEPYARVYRGTVKAEPGATYRNCLFLGPKP